MEKYATKMRGQFDTWAGDLPKGRVVAIGPRCSKGLCGGGEGVRLWQPSHCAEMWLACKALTYLRLARAHAAEWDFDWVFGLNEDQYVDIVAIRAALAKFDPSTPIAVAHVGCGLHWAYHPFGKQGKPRPDGCVAPRPHVCVCVCVRARVCVCVCARVCLCVCW